jgi:hypothetical protein
LDNKTFTHLFFGFEISLHKFKKVFQTTFDELQEKYVAIVDGNTTGGFFKGGGKFGKNWSVLKALHSSHTTLNEAFQNTKLLQNSPTLEILDVKKRDTLQEARLMELTTTLSSEVNSIQGIIQALEQDLKLMEQRHEIHKTTLSLATMLAIGTLHIHLKELGSNISNFESSRR